MVPGTGCPVTAGICRMTGAGRIPRSACMGRSATVIVGLPWFTLANCERLVEAVLASSNCDRMGALWGAR